MEDKQSEITWDFERKMTIIKDGRYNKKYSYEVQERNYRAHGVKCFVRILVNGDLLKEGLFDGTEEQFIKRLGIFES